MAFSTATYRKSMVSALRGRSNFTTSTSPKLKAYATTADSLGRSPGDIKPKKVQKGDYVPVFMAVGMIVLSSTFGLYTAYHQLGHAPNVTLKKSRRETIPEVVEPEQVAEQADRFVKQSFFRKVAHIQDFDRQEVVPDPIRGDVFNRPQRVEIEGRGGGS